VFAWKPTNMPGVPRDLIEYKLNVNPRCQDFQGEASMLRAGLERNHQKGGSQACLDRQRQQSQPIFLQDLPEDGT
jgi:hypothetical protein